MNWKPVKKKANHYYSDIGVKDESGFDVADVWTNQNDAKLIASAPALLKALKHIASLKEDVATPTDIKLRHCIQLATEAIANVNAIEEEDCTAP